MDIVPAIDVINGECVRLEKGVYDKVKVYHSDPLEAAKSFEDHGLNRLHLVDLDGAKASKVINWKVVERIATKTSLRIDFGGGIKRDEDLRIIFECGANQITVGSIAAENPDLFLRWLARYGPDKILLGADLKDGFIATRGWQEATKMDWKSFLGNYVDKGISHIICTDISKDGMLEGPAVELYREILSIYPSVKLTASGGVTTMADVEELAAINCDACIIGKAIYEGRITLSDLQKFSHVS